MMRKRENPHHRVWATRVIWRCAVHTILYDFGTTCKPGSVQFSCKFGKMVTRPPCAKFGSGSTTIVIFANLVQFSSVQFSCKLVESLGPYELAGAQISQ